MSKTGLLLGAWLVCLFAMANSSLAQQSTTGRIPVGCRAVTVQCIKAPCPTQIICTEPQVTVKCGWCGTGCVNMVAGDLRCPLIAPPAGKLCVNVSGKCTILPKVTPAPIKCGWCGTNCLDMTVGDMRCPLMPISSDKNCVNVAGKCTIVPTPDKPCSSDANCAANEYCYQPPMPACPTGAMCKLSMPMRVCRIKKVAGEGQMCGGIAGIMCDTGLTCRYPVIDGIAGRPTISMTDRSGTCIRIGTPPIKCDWCGAGCIDMSKGDVRCPMIPQPGGKSCINQSGKCTIVPNPDKPCSSDASCSANEYCYQPPMPVCKPGMACIDMMPMRVCRPCTKRLPCMDANPACAVDMLPGAPPFCPKPTPPVGTCGWCGSTCTRILPNAGVCAEVMPLKGVNCVEEAGKCVVKPVVPSCMPRPACADGIKDANGNMVYCDPRPGVIYCPVTSVRGDANGDGKVDLVDFAIWKSEYLGGWTSKKSDFNKDGKVDLADFSIWKNAYLYQVVMVQLADAITGTLPTATPTITVPVPTEITVTAPTEAPVVIPTDVITVDPVLTPTQ